MKNWRKIGFAVSAAVAVLSFSANAETQEVAGVVWTYQPCEGGVAVASGHTHRPAIPSNTVGSVAIPSQLGGQPVVKIGKYAFYGCVGVSAVAMSNDVNEVCDSAFRSCSNLVSVTLSSNIVAIGESAFRDCGALESVDFPVGLETIGESAFARCSALLSVKIPDRVTEIGQYAFQNCTGVTDVTLPDSLATVGRKPFDGCAHVTSVAFLPTFALKDLFPDSYSEILAVAMSSNTVDICAQAFENCSSLAAVELHPGLKTIGAKAFRGCTGLTAVILPDGVTEIGLEAFRKCTALKSVIVPASVTSLGARAFDDCKAITSVEVTWRFSLKDLFPDAYAKITSVKMLPGADKVDDEAFKGCKLIDAVNIPEGVVSIGENAFSGCANLKEIVLPGSLLNIGKKAFYNCKKIVSVTLPARFQVKDVFASAYRNITSVTIPQDSGEVPAQAFYGCKSLAVITFPATPPALADDAFQGLSEDVRIVVPAGSVSAYAAAADWRGYLWRIESDGEYPIVYALHRGENAEGNPLSYRADRLPIRLDEPTKAGCAFHGWYLNGVKVAEIPVGTTGCISLTASWWIAEPIEAPTADYVTYKAQYDGIVWDVAENRLVGVLRLKTTKMSENTRAVKISGYLLGLDGKKKTVKQNDKALLVPTSGPLAADFTVKDIGQMKLVIGGESVAGTLEGYQVRTFPVGGDWTRNDAVANAEATVFEGIPGTVQMQLLPVDEPVMPKNWKWAFNKAATVSWKKPKNRDSKCLVVDTSKGKTNLSGLKLTYTPKTGAFKGSFKIHALADKATRNEKTLKKYTVKVTGVVADGIGYGKAVLKKPANEWTLSVD